jgi:sortase A
VEHLLQKQLKDLRNLLKRLKKVRSSLLILFLGLFLIIFGGINYYQVRILSFSSVPQSAQESVENSDIPVEIIIPSMKIDLVVEPGEIENGVWKISDQNATFLNTSAVPGDGGNTVIYGHNKRVIFGNLPYVSVGQKVTVKTKSGTLYNYVVEEKFFVGPDRVDLVSPTDTEELTIYTCWGAFDSQRAVIKAKPII